MLHPFRCPCSIAASVRVGTLQHEGNSLFYFWAEDGLTEFGVASALSWVVIATARPAITKTSIISTAAASHSWLELVQGPTVWSLAQPRSELAREPCM